MLPVVLLDAAGSPVTHSTGFFDPIQGFAVAFLAFQHAIHQGPPRQCEVLIEIRRGEAGGLGGLVKQMAAHRALLAFVVRPERWQDVRSRAYATDRLSLALVLGGEAIGGGEEQARHILAIYGPTIRLQLACIPVEGGGQLAERSLKVWVRVVFDHRPAVHEPRIAPFHDGRRVAGAFPYGWVRYLPLNHLQPRELVDYTGASRAVFDMFVGRRLLRMAQGVVINGWREVSGNRARWSVPKGGLMSKPQALLHSGDFRIAASLPDAAVLARELQDFRVRFTEAGNATFNAREGAHDDLVLALALAVFGLSRPESVNDVRVKWAR